MRSVATGTDNCDTSHQSTNKPKTKSSKTSILTKIPRKHMVFVQPTWCVKNFSSELLHAWLDQENTLDEWNHLFFLTEVARFSDTVNPRDFESLADFSMKASLRKTTTKKKTAEATMP